MSHLRHIARRLAALPVAAALGLSLLVVDTGAAATPAPAPAPAPVVKPADDTYTAAARCRKINVRNGWGKADRGKLCWHSGGIRRSWIKVTGKLHDYRANRSNSYLYLSWKAGRKKYNKEVQGVSNGRTQGFNRKFTFIPNPGSIKLTVCSQVRRQWKCGVPQSF